MSYLHFKAELEKGDYIYLWELTLLLFIGTVLNIFLNNVVLKNIGCRAQLIWINQVLVSFYVTNSVPQYMGQNVFAKRSHSSVCSITEDKQWRARK